MYLYVGGDTAAALRGLVGIFDLDAATISKHSRDFLRESQRRGLVHDAGGGQDLPKSFVVTDKGVFLSPLNSSTLQARAHKFGLTFFDK